MSIKTAGLAVGVVFFALLWFFPAVGIAGEQDPLLKERGFVIKPTEAASLFDLYREDQHTLLTTDLLLHAWHRVFDTASRIAEIEIIRPALSDLSGRMVTASLKQANASKDDDLARLARANAAYFSVGATLLDAKYKIPSSLKKLVGNDFERAMNASSLAKSDVMSIGAEDGVQVDFALFRPRGRYTRTPELEQLFRALMWYSRAPLYLGGKGDGPIIRAYLVTQAIYSDSVALAAWKRLDEFVTFLAGPWDDSSPSILADILKQNLGGIGTPADLQGDRWQAIKVATNALPMPYVDSEPEFGKHRLFTLLGQRLSPDEYFIDEVVDPKTPGRWLPSALDVMFALGSDRAGTLPVDDDPDRGADPGPGRARARNLADSWQPEVLRETLAGRWLLAIRGLYNRPDGEVQEFIKHPLWETKLVQTGSASWTEMRHDLVAFIKPHYLTLCTIIPDKRPQWWTYVEPYPGVYGEIGLACARYIEILEAFGVKSEAAFKGLRSLGADAKRFERLATDELAGIPIEADRHDWVRLWPVKNWWLTQAPEGYEHLFSKADKRMALVVDVAHALDPSSGRATLQEAVGDPAEIVALGRFGSEEVKMLGGVYTHFEFVQRGRAPMTDEEWQAVQKTQPRPAYVKDLFPEEDRVANNQWQPLTIGDPFPGFYGYVNGEIGPAESVYIAVQARMQGSVSVWPLLKDLWISARNNDIGPIGDLRRYGPEAISYVGLGVIQSERFHRLVKKGYGWLKDGAIPFSRWVGLLDWYTGGPKESAEFIASMPDPSMLSADQDKYGIYNVVPDRTGIYVWQKGQAKPKKLVTITSDAFSMSPKRTKFAVTAGPLVSYIPAQGDLPAPDRLVVYDSTSGEILSEHSFPRVAIASWFVDGSCWLTWIDDDLLLIKWRARATDGLVMSVLDIPTNKFATIPPQEKLNFRSGGRDLVLWREDRILHILDRTEDRIVYGDGYHYSRQLNKGLLSKRSNDPDWDKRVNLLYLLDEKGNPGRLIATDHQMNISHPVSDPSAAVSPDGEKIAMAYESRNRFFLFDLKTESLTPLIDRIENKRGWSFQSWIGGHDLLFTYYERVMKEWRWSLVWMNGDTGEARTIYKHAKGQQPVYLSKPINDCASVWLLGQRETNMMWYHYSVNWNAPLFDCDRIEEYPLFKNALTDLYPIDPIAEANEKYQAKKQAQADLESASQKKQP